MNKKINFTCTLECGGKCCKGSTTLLASEISFYAEKVPMLPTITIIPDLMIKKDQKYRYEESFKYVDIPDTETLKTHRFFLALDFVTAGAYQGDLVEDCIFLSNGMCSVEENKPLKCKLIPIQPLVPPALLKNSFEQIKKQGCIGFDEPIKENSLIWKSGKIKKAEDLANLNSYWKEIKKSTSILDLIVEMSQITSGKEVEHSLLSIFMQGLENNLKEMMHNIRKNPQKIYFSNYKFILPTFEISIFEKVAGSKLFSNYFKEVTGLTLENFSEKQLMAFSKHREHYNKEFTMDPIFCDQELDLINFLKKENS